MHPVEYRFERRRPRATLWASLCASVAFLVAGAGQGDLSLLIAASALPLPFLIWSILLDPRAGVELAAGRIRWWTQEVKGEIPLALVQRAWPAPTGGGRRRFLLDLRDGRRIALPPEALPSGRTLPAALSLRGVAVAG
jgi:hypothetical protein